MAQSYKEVWSEEMEKSTYVKYSAFYPIQSPFSSPFHLSWSLYQFCLFLFSDCCCLLFSLFHSEFYILSLSFLRPFLYSFHLFQPFPLFLTLPHFLSLLIYSLFSYLLLTPFFSFSLLFSSLLYKPSVTVIKRSIMSTKPRH